MGENALKSEFPWHVIWHDFTLPYAHAAPRVRVCLPARLQLPERAMVPLPLCAHGAGHSVTNVCRINK